MATTVNDGSVKWQAIKLSEADTLGGLTASEIKSQAISGKVVQFQGIYGTFTLDNNYKKTATYTIPLPSGYTRQQCAYYVEPAENHVYGGDYIAAKIDLQISHVNQSNGVISVPVTGDSPTSYRVTCSSRYLVFSAK